MSKKHKNINGFTLIEILIVMAILATVLGYGVTRLNDNSNQIRSTVRKLTTIGKRLQSLARLNQMTYRLVIHIPEEENPNQVHSFWVESRKGAAYLNTNPEDLEDTEEDEDADNPRPPDPTNFSVDKKVLKRAIELPSDVYFTSVESGTLNKVFTSGISYIHFFPQGSVEPAAIQLEAGDLKWTLTYNPLTGEGYILNTHTTLANVRGK